MGNSEIPAKREKCKAAYHKTSFTPWNPDNGYIGNDTDNPPSKPMIRPPNTNQRKFPITLIICISSVMDNTFHYTLAESLDPL